jgi:hypothetical protein
LKLLKFINNLSLDVVLGAVFGQYFFARLLDIELSFPVYLVLGLSVWVIYTLDHLWDARFIKEKAISQRHFFHQEHFKSLSFALLIAFCSIVGLFFIFNELIIILIPGLIFSALIGSAFLILRYGDQKLQGLKEVSTALFYVLGIGFAPYFYSNELFDSIIFFVFGFGYFLMAWINLLILSYWDKREDEAHGFGSVLILISEDQLVRGIRLIFGVLFSVLILSLFFLPSFYHVHTSVLMGICGIHYWVFNNNDLNEKRLLLEWSFVLPFVLLVF